MGKELLKGKTSSVFGFELGELVLVMRLPLPGRLAEHGKFLERGRPRWAQMCYQSVCVWFQRRRLVHESKIPAFAAGKQMMREKSRVSQARTKRRSGPL